MEITVVVSAAVDIADIVAIVDVAVCALWTLSVSQIQCPFVKSLHLCSFNTILDSIDKRLSTAMKQKLVSTYFSFVRECDYRGQNVNINISDSWAAFRQLLTSEIVTTLVWSQCKCIQTSETINLNLLDPKLFRT